MENERLRHISLNKILKLVSKVTGLHEFAIKSKNRVYELVQARNMYFQLAKYNTNYSLSIIGYLVYRDHSTVIHGIRTIENDYNKNYRKTKYYMNKLQKKILKYRRKKKKYKSKDIRIKYKYWIEYKHSKLMYYGKKGLTTKQNTIGISNICRLFKTA